MSKQPLDPKNVDRRLAPRLITQGLIDEATYQKHIKSLPDLAEMADVVETKMDDEDESDEQSE